MATQTASNLTIVYAAYGLSEFTSQVSNLVKGATNLQTVSFTASNQALGGDPWPNQLKSLTVLYSYDGGGIAVKAAKEGETVSFGQAEYNRSLQCPWMDTSYQAVVWGATYGPVDMTIMARGMVVYTDGHRSGSETLSVTGVANNAYFGDTWYGVEKTFVIVVGYQGKVYNNIGNSIWRENMSVYILLPLQEPDVVKNPVKGQ